MSLTLYVEGDRWRAHLRGVIDREPDLVPVAKGNGYGFGLGRLARRSAWLGVDTIAVGTFEEVSEVERRFAGSILVMTPWRATATTPSNPRIVHTIGRLEDLTALRERADGNRPRVVLELITSMLRHGFDVAGLKAAAADSAGLHIEGVALHLPLSGGGKGHLAEVERLLNDVAAAGLTGPRDGRPATIWVSHLVEAELAELRSRWADLRFRPRVGTDLWLGDRSAMQVRATVLDAHPVVRGQRFGYRQRPAPRAGTVLVVSGGTAHGIGLEAPIGDTSLRSRAASIARGGLDAAGVVRSPFTVDRRPRLFAEPPHMQASMLFLPAGCTVPDIGDQVDVRVRYTATTFDQVQIS